MTNLEEYLNNLPIHFFFLVVDKFLDITLPNLTNFESISPWSLKIELTQKNSGRLLSHPNTLDYIKTHTPKGKTPAIIPFKPSPKVDLICHQQGWINISNTSQINRYLEDKIIFSKLMDDHQLPQIPHQIAPLNQESFVQAQDELGQKLVIQTHFGWAGNSSYIANSWDDVKLLIPTNTPVKFTPFWNGTSLINNCCLTPQGLIQSPIGRQYTGIPELTNNRLATVGRQWPAHISSEISQQIFAITSELSKLLIEKKYRGFFGLDFFVHQNKAYLLECNPRLTASFAFYTKIENRNNLDPLFYFHLLSFLANKYPININQQQRHLNTSLVGTELTKKNSIGATVKKLQKFEDLYSTTATYNISPSELQYFL